MSSADDAIEHQKPTHADEFHPDLRWLARLVPGRGMPRMTPRGLWLARKIVPLLGRHGPREVEVIPLGGSAALRVHRPLCSTAPLAALLWMHGGCYVLGSASQDDELCHRFAHTLGFVVASVDYRVAPEDPYPAALDDCVTAFDWLTAQCDVDSSRIAVGGGSAGGGLAAALAQRLRDRGTTQPAMQLLTYPMLDDRPAYQVDPNYKQRRFMGQDMNRFGWDSYLGGSDPEEAVPARADTLAGLPPAWMGVGTLDLLFDENLKYAQRLEQDGVHCTLEIVPGAFHGFDLVAPKAGVSRQFFGAQCAALRAALGPSLDDRVRFGPTSH